MTDQTPRTEALEDALWKVIWEAAVIGSSQGRLSPETWQKAKDVLAQARAEGLDVERWYEAVSDALAATTEGTDYAEAPEPSDEPRSPYVMRLTHELLARLHPAEYNAIFGSQMS